MLSFGRMKMCHMLADSPEELLAMVDGIGIARKHLQMSRRGVPHFDICKAKRTRAVEQGAVEVNWKQMVEILRRAKAMP